MRKTLCIFVSLLLCLTIHGQQSERIINFHSDIVIDTDGRIQVTEQIKVYAAGKEIKRGIVRQIPLYRKDVNDNSVKVGIRVLSVRCDGQEAKFRTEREDGDMVIYVGDKDVFLDPGVYEYDITYESRGHIGFFDDFDELYWNVTGNDWVFQIEKVSAAITLPGGATAINTACYEGAYGSTDTGCSVDDQGNRQIFFAGRPLQSHEGLTISVSFPRDMVKRPPPPTKAELFWNNYKRHICALLGMLIAGCFFFFTWRKVGKDPEQPVAIPTFKPPHDWSPATTRYLYKRKYDNKVFTATLVGMAVKGAILIEYENKQYKLKKIEKDQDLSPEELHVYDILFASSKTLTVTGKNHTRFSKAINNLENDIEEKWDIKDYFLKNWKYIVFGGIITIAVMVLYAVLTGAGSIFGMLFTSPFIVIGLGVLVMAFRQKIGCASIFMAIWGIGFSLGALVMAGAILSSIHWVTAVFLLLMPISYAVYIYLIKAPTVLGAKTTAELEGFRMYLKTAEEHRLNMLTPPERTPELFEKLLSYAIALDVDNEWCKKFDNVLKQLNYEPQWYTGSGPFVFTNFGHSFTNSFNSSISSARVDPSSSSSSGSSSSGSHSWSSGSSGGGFSGGGGGGGGGRGW